MTDLPPRRILVVDNYDSFVFNLVQYLAQLGAECTVVRNDEVAPADARGYDGVLLSPGPGTPEKAGVCVDLVRDSPDEVPAPRCLPRATRRSRSRTAPWWSGPPSCCTARPARCYHEGAGVLAGLPVAVHRHPLPLARGRPEDTLPAELEVTGRTASGVVMAMRHRDLPLEGVQFHPESVLTEGGHRLLANWLVTCGDPAAPARAEGLAPVVPPHEPDRVRPAG